MVGRRVYDHTHGWGGDHPLAVPLFLVTHRPPEAWPTPEAPFTAVSDGVDVAVAMAVEVAGSKDVALAGPSIIQQALALDLVDELAIDLAPVVLGGGVPFFGALPGGALLLDDPEVTEGSRVVHLRYPVRRRGARPDPPRRASPGAPPEGPLAGPGQTEARSTQRSTVPASVARGMIPARRTTSWNSLMSNPSPSTSVACARSRSISRRPTMYESA